MGLMGSSCESKSPRSLRSSATGTVSAATGARLTVAASELDTFLSDPGTVLGSVCLWKFNGCLERVSLKGFTISARPLARSQG